MLDPTTLPDDLPEPVDDNAADLERFAERGARISGLSDADLELTRALDLPTFEVEGMTLIRRVTLLVRAGVIDDVVYPVFPPNLGAELALARL